NLRNLLLDRTIRTRSNDTLFNMATIGYLCQKDPEVAEVIKPEYLKPADKMELNLVVKLLKAIPAMKASKVPEAKLNCVLEEISYLESAELFFNSFNTNSEDTTEGN